MKRWLVLGLVLLLAFASGAWADRLLSRTYFTAVMSDVTDFRIAQNPNGTVDGYLRSNVRASDGVGYVASYIKRLTPAQVTTIANFISGQFLPGLNTQEGL